MVLYVISFDYHYLNIRLFEIETYNRIVQRFDLQVNLKQHYTQKFIEKFNPHIISISFVYFTFYQFF